MNYEIQNTSSCTERSIVQQLTDQNINKIKKFIGYLYRYRFLQCASVSSSLDEDNCALKKFSQCASIRQCISSTQNMMTTLN